MTKRAGKVKLTYEALEDALNLKKGHRIERTFDSSYTFKDEDIIFLKISGPDMPEQKEGEDLQVVDLPVKNKKSIGEDLGILITHDHNKELMIMTCCREMYNRLYGGDYWISDKTLYAQSKIELRFCPHCGKKVELKW